MKTARIYEIYPTSRGYSSRRVDYRGVHVLVAAVSIRQAYFLAANARWVEKPTDRVGVLARYSRERGWLLGCGCRPAVVPLHHGDGARAIARHRAEHDCMEELR